MHYLDFEEHIGEVEEKLSQGQLSLSEQKRLQNKLTRLIDLAYKRLTPWQRTQIARHEDRPHASDYIKSLFQNFVPLSGDRVFGEDKALLGGLAQFHGRTVMVLAQEKGNNTQTRIAHNFGMACPEGYRKAVRLMKLAEKFQFPVLTFVDTPGAFPGVEAEARGQGQAISECISVGLDLRVPLLTTIIGEGGSGGALALATGNKILMLENAIYSVISPEGCASILWKDFKFAHQATRVLRLTAKDLLGLKVIDAIIPEPKGGAHRFPKQTIQAVDMALQKALADLTQLSPDAWVAERHEKFLQMGQTLKG